MKFEIDPRTTTRASAFELWMQAPNPMVTFFKTLDVTNLVRLSRNKHYKFNMLMLYCIGKAAAGIDEFYLLPVANKLMKYDSIAINTIVKHKDGGICSCDILYSDNLIQFASEYQKFTQDCKTKMTDRDLSDSSMVIGTSAVVETELDGIVGMNSGIYNNPFLFWGRHRHKLFRYDLPVSFQFHHTQMDGQHAGQFLDNLQREIRCLKG